MTTRFGHRRANGGFTLLEILISTVVAAFILLVINGTYVEALRLHNSTQLKIDQDLILDRTLGLVRRDLEGLMLPGSPTAVAPIGTFSGQFQDTPMETPSQEFTATRVSPDLYTTTGEINGWSPFSEVQEVTYYLAAASDGSNTKNLVRAVTRNLLYATQPTTDEQTLITGVVNAVFDYYDGTSWDPTWDTTSTSELPVAIRFTLTLASPDSPQPGAPIQLVVPVLVTTKTSQKQIIQGTPTGGTTQ